MVFRQCSIGGKVYSGSSGEEPKTSDSRATVPTSSAASSGESGSATAVPSTANAETPIKLPQGVLQRFYDKTLQADLAAAQGAEAKTQAASQARTLNGFFTVLSLCHTAIAALDQETGAIEYKAQSPDEAALVQAAADSGFIFCGKDKEIFKIRTPFVDHVEEYELLNLLEFNSTRKRMSVIVRKLDEGDDRIFLLCKGADNVSSLRLFCGSTNEPDRSSSKD
jgi:phospholipid-translocating ATPase